LFYDILPLVITSGIQDSGMINISGGTILNRVKEAGALVTEKGVIMCDQIGQCSK